jgi:glycosyltransferase involved in cell wall biosynthesis
MRLAIAVLTYNRMGLFLDTLQSIGTTFLPTTVVDNGSSDGTQNVVKMINPGGYLNQDGNHTAGHGMNLAIERALRWLPDIVLFTADDYHYRPDWQRKLTDFWEGAPERVALVSCHLEPDYDWNQPSGVVRVGAQQALVRDSLPGSNWSFRASEWPIIGPIAETTGGEDLDVCRRLREQGRQLCALDLAIHTGEQRSIWGNQSWRIARELDREKWRV